MKIKCEICKTEFNFIIENEGWSENEDYKQFNLECDHCEAPCIIYYFMPSEIAEQFGSKSLK